MIFWRLKIKLLAFFAFFLFLCLLPKPSLAGCGGGYTCGTDLRECLPKGCSIQDCDDPKDPICSWKIDCEHYGEPKDCIGDTSQTCLKSPGCGFENCSGPNAVSCVWTNPPGPTNTPVPTDIPPTNTPVPTDTPEPTVPACSGCTLPNTLTLVSPANGSSTGETQPTFSWTLGSWGYLPDGCTLGSYLIKIANNPGFSPNEVDESGLCSTTHPLSCSYIPISPLALGTHYYRIYAFTGCGSIMQEASFTIVAATPTLTPTSVLSPTPSITLVPSLTLTPSPTPTAGPWEKLSRGSYHSKEYYRLVNPIPQVVSAYDSDDSTTPYFVIDKPGVTGEAGIVSGRTIDITPASRVSHNFWSKSSYQSKPGFTHETFLRYVNSKKTSKTITDPADIAEDDGIYKMSTATLTDKAVFGSSNFVLIVSGTVNINLSSPNTDFSPTGSMAILADTINFNSNVTTAKGIFIANTINIAEADDKGIKITGNLIALDSFVNGRNWDSTNNTKPSLFVVFDPKQYLDLLPYLSISKYDWKEMQ